MVRYDPNNDAYVVLGADPSASAEDIERAFRAAVRTWHPDKSPAPDAANQFRNVQDAAKILRNPQRRADYDRLRALRLGAHASRRAKPKTTPPPRAQPNVPMRPPPSWLADRVTVKFDSVVVSLEAPRPLDRTINILGASSFAALGAGLASGNMVWGALAATLWAIGRVLVQPPHDGNLAWARLVPGQKLAQFHSLNRKLQKYLRLDVPYAKLRISIVARRSIYSVRIEGIPRVTPPVLMQTRCPMEAVKLAAEAGRWFEVPYQSRAA